MTTDDRARHWDTAYESDEHSWTQASPDVSLAMLSGAGVGPAASVIDVGGGDSPLAATLLDRGHRDVTVMDVSQRALDTSAVRLGDRRERVWWLRADITSWEPERTWQVWHDRAVFHFLTAEPDREAYRQALLRGTGHGSVVVVGTFAPDGPEQCSGLPVQRYAPAGLVAALPDAFTPVAEQQHVHITPWGTQQPFTWVALRRT